MNQLKPILIEDFNEIKSPSSLKYSPAEKEQAYDRNDDDNGLQCFLAFCLFRFHLPSI